MNVNREIWLHGTNIVGNTLKGLFYYSYNPWFSRTHVLCLSDQYAKNEIYEYIVVRLRCVTITLWGLLHVVPTTCMLSTRYINKNLSSPLYHILRSHNIQQTLEGITFIQFNMTNGAYVTKQYEIKLKKR